ncbi:MAG: CPBP family intramembrane metalloprotease [Anaerolineae bacterium]|nr:CPBP family intramembrane metalloprotease [Anaerolineae bacterium]
MDILTLVLGLVVLLAILGVANLRYSWAHPVTVLMVLAVNALLILNGFSYLLIAGIPDEFLADMPGGLLASSVTPAQAGNVILVSLLMAGAASVLLVPQVRRWIAQTQLLTPAFDPDSTMHMVALVLCVYLVGQSALSFALVRDLGELAEDLSATPVVEAALLQAALFYFVAAAGVGLFLRRDWRAALKRLGLVWPAWWQVLLAIGAAAGLLVLEFIVIAVWMALAGEAAFLEQTQAAGVLTDSIDNMAVAFLMAFTSSTGEEIAFRGALQPVLGVGLTAIMFAAGHIQYAISPATLLVLVLGVVLGVIRVRTNTTTAILTHFFYNFALMSLAVLTQQALELLPDGLPETSALLLGIR